MCILLLLGFGLPVFLLPEKLEGEGKWIERYNKTLGSSTYKEKVKPVVDKALGGSLRLFVQKVILVAMKKWCSMRMRTYRMEVRWNR